MHLGAFCCISSEEGGRQEVAHDSTDHTVTTQKPELMAANINLIHLYIIIPRRQLSCHRHASDSRSCHRCRSRSIKCACTSRSSSIHLHEPRGLRRPPSPTSELRTLRTLKSITSRLIQTAAYTRGATSYRSSNTWLRQTHRAQPRYRNAVLTSERVETCRACGLTCRIGIEAIL